MTQPSSSAAECRLPGPPGPGVPLSAWPGLPALGGAPRGLPPGGRVTTAVARAVVESFSRSGDLPALSRGQERPR
jgi:hypothetical protein